MKIIAAIGVVSLLAACVPSEPYREQIPVEVCDGKLQQVTGKHLRMTCNDGRMIDYTSYKYDMTVKASSNINSQIPQ